jgi:DNA-binding transcriptional LysR family regulator
LIQLRSAGGTELVSSLLSGEVDAAVISRPPAEPEIEVLPLYSEATKLIVSAKDPLAGATHIDLAELRDRAFVALSYGTWSFEELLIACGRAGFVPKVNVEASDMMALQGIVRQGIAIAIIAERLASHGRPEIVALTIDGVAARRRTVSLAYPRKARDTRAIAALRAAAKAFPGRKR